MQSLLDIQVLYQVYHKFYMQLFVDPQHKTTKRRDSKNLLSTFVANNVLMINEPLLRRILGHCFLLESPQT